MDQEYVSPTLRTDSRSLARSLKQFNHLVFFDAMSSSLNTHIVFVFYHSRRHGRSSEQQQQQHLGVSGRSLEGQQHTFFRCGRRQREAGVPAPQSRPAAALQAHSPIGDEESCSSVRFSIRGRRRRQLLVRGRADRWF
jgi:hypothetical protein